MNFKEALIAHLQGEKVEVKTFTHWEPFMYWVSLGGATLCGALAEANFATSCEFRIAPRTIIVNGVEVPSPESVAPEVGVVYFSPNPSEKYLCCKSFWAGDSFDMHRLTTKQIYLNKDDAIARAKAMLLTSDK